MWPSSLATDFLLDALEHAIYNGGGVRWRV
jgi:hypothetical protein